MRGGTTGAGEGGFWGLFVQMGFAGILPPCEASGPGGAKLLGVTVNRGHGY